MSNDVTIFQHQTNEVTVKSETGLADKMAAARTLRRIATNTNGTFRRVVDGEPIGKAIPGAIDVIIVDFLPEVSRTYYKDAYDPGNPTLPDCWSNLGVEPEDNVPNRQASACNVCPQNIEGSADNGRSRACRFNRRIAVQLPKAPNADVYQMNIAAMSLFGKGNGYEHPFESYKKYLKANDEALDTVVTRVAYDLDADTMTLKFQAVRHLTQQEVEFRKAAQADPETESYCVLTVAAASKVATKPKLAVVPKPKAPPVTQDAPGFFDDGDDDEGVAPPPAAEMVVDNVPTEPIAEPKKRAARKPRAEPAVAAAGAGGNLASILDSWNADAGEEDEG